MSTTMDRPRGKTDRGNELLSIRLNGQEFAISIMAIREIRGWVASTNLPHAPSYILGMINLRGTVLVVIDLAQRLGLGGQDPIPASVVVVVEANNRVVGLLVDEVCDIITVTDAMRQDTPTIRRLAEGYPTGALAEFSIAGPWWQLDRGGAQLLRFLAPRDLPEVAA